MPLIQQTLLLRPTEPNDGVWQNSNVGFSWQTSQYRGFSLQNFHQSPPSSLGVAISRLLGVVGYHVGLISSHMTTIIVDIPRPPVRVWQGACFLFAGEDVWCIVDGWNVENGVYTHCDATRQWQKNPLARRARKGKHCGPVQT